MEESRLKQAPLFAGLSSPDLRRLSEVTDLVQVRPGARLVDEGQSAYEFVVIEDGTAEVVRDGNRVAVLGPGDFFGELGVLDDAPRHASVVATSPMSAIVMTARDLRAVMDEMPGLAEQISRIAEQRRSAARG